MKALQWHPPLSTTSNIPHTTPEPWTLTLCIMGSQITVCPPQQLKIPVVHVPHWETSFVLFSCTHTQAHTGPIQQPFSHLVYPLVPLWHCLWKHVHLVLPCLPPPAMVPITHILSPLHSLFSSFFFSSPNTLTPQGILTPLSCAPSSFSLLPRHDMLLPYSCMVNTLCWLNPHFSPPPPHPPLLHPYEWNCACQIKTIKSIKPPLFLLSLLYSLYPLFHWLAKLLSLWSSDSFMFCLSLSGSLLR